MTPAQIVIACALTVALVLYVAYIAKVVKDMRAMQRETMNKIQTAKRALDNQAHVRELMVKHFTPEQRAKIWHDAQVIAQFRRELEDDATWEEEVRGGDYGDRGADGAGA